MTSEELIKKLEQSEFSAAKDAIVALENCSPTLNEGFVSCSELLDIYKVRLNHLSNMSSLHAQQLAGSTKEFVTCLATIGEERAQIITINPDEEVSFLIFLLSSGKLLGCLKTISKLAVTEERWEQLWAKP
jgi:hypothetical protein